MAQGLDGVVPGLANVVPLLFHRWWRALQQADSTAAHLHETAIRRFTDLYERIPGTAPYMQVFRSGLSLLGMDPGDPSGLRTSLDEPFQQRIREALAHADHLVSRSGEA